MTTNIERKAVDVVDFKLDEAGVIEVAFAQLGIVDRDSDVTLPGAIPTKEVPMSGYGHTSWSGALPVGKGTVTEAGDWGVFRGKFLMDTDQGRNAYATVKGMGDLQEWSYGYDPVDYAFGQHDGRDVRFLKRLDIFEVSPVLLGAGIGTHTRSVKGVVSALDYGAHLDWMLAEARAIIDRSANRAEWRAKEGRVLSSSNRDRLASLADAMESAVVDLRALLEESEPSKARIARQVAALREMARVHGVTID